MMMRLPAPVNLLDQLVIGGRQRNKVVVVVGPTGSGKSRLSIDLATQFDAEIVNSDKIQVYRGLNIATNKVTRQEARGVPHHLLGVLDPDAGNFSPREFARRAAAASESIARRARLPIIAGGSNSCIRALVADDAGFRSRFECCFLWVDASAPALHAAVARRVDRMVRGGLVDESRPFFDPGGDYTRGIRRAIGVPEMDELFRNEGLVGRAARASLLEAAVVRIKANTCDLASRQTRNILRLQEGLHCRLHRLDATEVLLRHARGEEEADEAWTRLVSGPGATIVSRFLSHHDDHDDIINNNSQMAGCRRFLRQQSPPAIATAAKYY